MSELVKFSKIKALGHEDNKDIFLNKDEYIEITEKLDGANFRFYVTKEGKVIFGSRTQQLTSDEGEYTNMAKNFTRCAEFVREKTKNGIFYPGIIYFGECMVKHTLDYDWESIPPFLGFAVYDLKEEKYLVDWEEFFKELNLPTVPIIAEMRVEELIKQKIDDNFVPITVYPPKANPKQQAEGVVFKNYKSKLMAKYVRTQFKEENAATFGGTPKYQENDTGLIACKYCTNARIEKNIFKLVDEDEELGLSLMHKLPKRVMADIAEEHYNDIILSNYKLNFQDLRKTITKRCLVVLKQVLVNNSLGDKND